MGFNFDTSNPTDASVVSAFPANERSFRGQVSGWVQTEHDLNGRHVIGTGTTTARNAITTFGVGNLWFNTDTVPAVLQRCTATGTPATFESIGSANVGTVTSVGLSLPAIFTVTGSPVTVSGTLTAVLANQNANLVFAGPSSGGAAAPTFRALVVADIPSGVVGTRTDGTTLTMNPAALNTFVSGAHNLSVTPKIESYMECLTAELGYSIGDRVYLGSQDTNVVQLNFTVNATTAYISVGNTLNLLKRDGSGQAAITLANWKIVLIPYVKN